ncbi:DUF1622 domain-containing protein [Aliiglaciecola sp. CAU 1673]|uniref:DUF1622 domain-containing protein n=1 Tax=Aliiglaciecola sp. CAU 1673 TaxID=3032595 RepID=UPI0023DAA9C0|nr:DUF1622 domain-containing protein [Aliiglaciecola sp. CAU 1673]MDF2177847.1 DUF1622 domain-containing protein [Aliiglaciecola sp. CAU 1673]
MQNGFLGEFVNWITLIGYSIEAFGVIVIVVGALVSTVHFLRGYRLLPQGQAYQCYRQNIGRSIILGLEFLIAGDIIRTVVVADSLENLMILGLIILIRAFLGLMLHLEVEGSWPWKQQQRKD